jgi:hypothetical protein
LTSRNSSSRALGRDVKQGDEVALDVLDEIIGRARLQRRHRDAGILRRRDEHHRRRARDRHDLLQRLQSVEAGHVLVERHDIYAAVNAVLRTRAADELEAFLAACGVNDLVAAPRQAAIDQARQRPVVVNVEQCGRTLIHGAAGGTWMTEKNKPSCRMALAKFS